MRAKDTVNSLKMARNRHALHHKKIFVTCLVKDLYPEYVKNSRKSAVKNLTTLLFDEQIILQTLYQKENEEGVCKDIPHY